MGVEEDSNSADSDESSFLMVEQSQQEHRTALPNQCKEFFDDCGYQPLPRADKPKEVKKGFTKCCLKGKHKRNTCYGLADEAFKRHTTKKTMVAAPLCKEMVDLLKTHNDWQVDQAEQAVVANATSAATLQEEDQVSLEESVMRSRLVGRKDHDKKSSVTTNRALL